MKKNRPIPMPASADLEIGSDAWQQLIVQGAVRFNLSLHRGHTSLFAAHARELILWNRKMNLTAIQSPLDVAVKHYLDSLLPAAFIDPGTSLLDVGSGAGFPGIPLKIVTSSLSASLVDASRKKVAFMNHVIRKLGLKDIQAHQVRIENLKDQEGCRQGFDRIICRAFSNLKAFASLALPYLKKTGMLIALKGRAADSELKQLTTLRHGELHLKLKLQDGVQENLAVEVVERRLPYLNDHRQIILLRRMG
jgi:16S rRNA (guanine527-N7)-methyltransferase